jgi:hypothetical protein
MGVSGKLGSIVGDFILFCKIILQKYTTVSKFYTFDIHSSWPTAVRISSLGTQCHRRRHGVVMLGCLFFRVKRELY